MWAGPDMGSITFDRDTENAQKSRTREQAGIMSDREEVGPPLDYLSLIFDTEREELSSSVWNPGG